MNPQPDCAEIGFLMQADLDGELDIAGNAVVAAHVAGCPSCAAQQAALAALSARLRGELPFHAAPARLRERLLAEVPPAPARRRWRWPGFAFPFSAGAMLAAAVVLAVVLPGAPDSLDSVLGSHIRALQPGHLMDVLSTDQHTVKPWFDGRLDYAPPVKDLAAAGFPLAGGRLDYLAGRPVAALAYHSAKHVIDLYIWPGSAGPAQGERNGYNYRRWSRDGMQFWAISDLNPAELQAFVEAWMKL